MAGVAAVVRPPEGAVVGPGQIGAGDALRSATPVLWVDARTAEAYAGAHWPDAVLLNEDNWDELIEPVLGRWSPGMKVVVYCSTSGCRRSEEVAKRLREEVGLGDVWSLAGGWDALKREKKALR